MSLDSYQLKTIALITMFIDHGAMAFRAHLSDSLYLLLRSVGRLSFPIFCFLLAEGFFHTRDRNHYLGRLLLFGFLSEIPFDLVLEGTSTFLERGASMTDLMDFSSQNVFFTLALGFTAMILMESFRESPLCIPAVLIIFPLLGEIIRCDYGAMGILTIIFFYFHRKTGGFPLGYCFIPLLILGLRSWVQLLCLFSLPLMLCYNGEKGKGPKYFYYIAYPGHLYLYLFIKLWHQSH